MTRQLDRIEITIMVSFCDRTARAMPRARLGAVLGIEADRIDEVERKLKRLKYITANIEQDRKTVSDYLYEHARRDVPPSCAMKLVRGVPTGYGAPIAKREFAVSGRVPVWPCEMGVSKSKGVVGYGLDPVCPGSCRLPACMPPLYELFALVDMFRIGRVREREFARRTFADLP